MIYLSRQRAEGKELEKPIIISVIHEQRDIVERLKKRLG